MHSYKNRFTIAAGSIINADISSTDQSSQSKLAMQAATTRANQQTFYSPI